MLCTLTNIELISCYLSTVSESYSVHLPAYLLLQLFSRKPWSLLRHQPPSVLAFREEAGLFQSRKRHMRGSRPAVFVVCQTRWRNVDLPGWQAATHIPEWLPPTELCHPQPPTSACPLPPSPTCRQGPWDSSCNPGASSSPFSLF